jgi:hypothetical protein
MNGTDTGRGLMWDPGKANWSKNTVKYILALSRAIYEGQSELTGDRLKDFL